MTGEWRVQDDGDVPSIVYDADRMRVLKKTGKSVEVVDRACSALLFFCAAGKVPGVLSAGLYFSVPEKIWQKRTTTRRRHASLAGTIKCMCGMIFRGSSEEGPFVCSSIHKYQAPEDEASSNTYYVLNQYYDVHPAHSIVAYLTARRYALRRDGGWRLLM